jgi:hypothetical protein
MDGKGRWIDNVFVERLWRSVKYEEVYLKAYETLTEARQALSSFLTSRCTTRAGRIRAWTIARPMPCTLRRRRPQKAGPRRLNFEHGFPTAGRFPVRRKRPNRPAVENPASQFITLFPDFAVQRSEATSNRMNLSVPFRYG